MATIFGFKISTLVGLHIDEILKSKRYVRLHGRLGSTFDWLPGEDEKNMRILKGLELAIMPTPDLIKFAENHKVRDILVHTTEAKHNIKLLEAFSRENKVWIEGGLTESIASIYMLAALIATEGNIKGCGVVIDLGHLVFGKPRDTESYKKAIANAIDELTMLSKAHPEIQISFHIPLGHNGYTRDAVDLYVVPKELLSELLKIGDGPITIEAQGRLGSALNPFSRRKNGIELIKAHNYINGCLD